MDDFDKEDREKDGLNLAGFLFGNIDERGELEDSDILDDVRMTRTFIHVQSDYLRVPCINYCALLWTLMFERE